MLVLLVHFLSVVLGSVLVILLTPVVRLMAELAREQAIHYVLALQEAVAIAMADGYAQASGGLAAANVHVSPGLSNAMGMLYDAMKSGAPLLLTAGQHDQSFTVT